MRFCSPAAAGARGARSRARSRRGRRRKSGGGGGSCHPAALRGFSAQSRWFVRECDVEPHRRGSVRRRAHRSHRSRPRGHRSIDDGNGATRAIGALRRARAGAGAGTGAGGGSRAPLEQRLLRRVLLVQAARLGTSSRTPRVRRGFPARAASAARSAPPRSDRRAQCAARVKNSVPACQTPRRRTGVCKWNCASQTTPQQWRNECATMPLTAHFACPTRAARRTAAETTRHDHIPTLQPPTLSSDTSSCPRSRRRASTERRTLQHKHERAPSSSTAARARRKRARPRSHGVAVWTPFERHHQVPLFHHESYPGYVTAQPSPQWQNHSGKMAVAQRWLPAQQASACRSGTARAAAR